MTWFLKAYDPEEPSALPLPLATRRASSFGEQLGAAVTMGRIEDDSWGRSGQFESQYLTELEGAVGDYISPEAKARQRGALPYMAMGGIDQPLSPSAGPRKAAVLAAIAKAKAADPEKWKDLPDSPQAIEAEIIRRRNAEYAEAAEIAAAAPDGAFMANFLGRAYAGLSDPASIATMGFGGSAGKGVTGFLKFVAGESALGAASELAIAGRRQDVADQLDVPEPNLLADMGIAALTAGVFAGGLGAIGHGVKRFVQYRTERGTGTAESRNPDVSPGLHEGAIRDAGRRLEGDTSPAKSPRQPDGHVAWEAFEFTPAGNASPKSNRVGYVYGRLIEKGMPPHIAAGFVGNFMVESRASIDPHAVGDGGSAVGIAQWNDRRPALIEFARKRGKDWQDLDTQIDFILHELDTTEGRAKAEIWATTTPQDAALAVSRYYERPGVPHNDRRAGFARSVYDQASNGQVPKYEGLALGDASYGPASGGGFTPTSRGYTGEGQIVVGDRRIDVEYVVVDASLLRKAEGRFQPRDRSRANSDIWIAETAARLDPALLMPQPTAAHGTPIIGPNNMIESGNGRVAAIMRAYDQHPDRAAAYRQQIEAEGFTVPEGVERPVLIARRKTHLTDDELEQMAIDAQDSGVARMTPTEIARTSARAMTADRLAIYRPDARLQAEENLGFVRSVLAVLPRSERNALFTEENTLNSEGRRRMADAFFARAWPDPRILTRYAEGDETSDLKSLIDALEAAAPSWTAMLSDVETGRIRPEFDITAHVMDALVTIIEARKMGGKAGQTVAQAMELILGHDDMLDGAMNPLVRGLLRKFWRNGRAAPAAEIARFLSRYADEARMAGRPDDMLGARPADVLRTIDSNAFADLPDDIPPLAPPPARPAELPDLPETAFAKGADSPEAEAADQLAVDVLKTPETGPFGPIHRQYEGKPQEAIARILADKTGEAIGVLKHPDLKEPIDLIYGKAPGPGEEGFGLAKIAEKHPEVLDDLQGFLSRLKKDEAKSGPNRTRLSDETGRAVVRLDFDKKSKTWLMTAYEKEHVGSTATTDTGAVKAPDDTASRGTDTSQNIVDPAAGGKIDDIDRQIATARAEFQDLGDFELPDGTRAADLLDDLDADETLNAVIDACTLGGKNT